MYRYSMSTEIIKPKLDSREYLHYKLPNGIETVLISDSTTDQSAAALLVEVGYLFDTVPGIAHFLEHMMFMGSRKYPQENMYQQYLNQHGGSSNAFTVTDHTLYYFDIQLKFPL